MPPAKRSKPASSRSSSKPADKRTGSSTRSSRAQNTQRAARSGAKATTTSARRAAGATSTQAKSGASRTRNAASGGAGRTGRSARSTGSAAATTAQTAGSAAAETTRAARSGAKGTGSAAGTGAKGVTSGAKAATTRVRRVSGSDGIVSVGEQLVRGAIHPRDVVMLTRDRIQETLDDAAARGRVTRRDANNLVAELVRRGQAGRADLQRELESLLARGRSQLDTTSKRARSSGSVDRVVRASDRARRSVGVGSSFPIAGYDELTAVQVQKRIKELSKPERRKVLTYERNHANRKSVVGALEKSLA